jgi:chromosome segregation ATPase
VEREELAENARRLLCDALVDRIIDERRARDDCKNELARIKSENAFFLQERNAAQEILDTQRQTISELRIELNVTSEQYEKKIAAVRQECDDVTTRLLETQAEASSRREGYFSAMEQAEARFEGAQDEIKQERARVASHLAAQLEAYLASQDPLNEMGQRAIEELIDYVRTRGLPEILPEPEP